MIGAGRFERRIVLALLVCAVIPLGASAWMVDRLIGSAEALATGEGEGRQAAIERARGAYIALFADRKAALKQRGAELARAAPAGPGGLERFLDERLASDGALKFVRVVHEDGSPPIDRTRPGPFQGGEFRELRVDEAALGRRFELTYVTPRAPFREFEELGEIEAGGAGLGILHQRIGGVYRVVFLGGLGLALIAAAGLGLLLARGVTRRVLQLSLATRRVAAGDLEARVAATGRDEIADLGRAFNRMVTELAQSRERIAYLQKIGAWQEVARHLAHEIKNPLTPIQLAVQQLRTSYVPPPQEGEDRYGRTLEEAAEIVGEEIAGLRRMVEEFSAFARLPRVECARVDAGLLVEEWLRGHADFEGRVELAAPAPAPTVNADRLLFRRALHNVVENALQAGATRVWVTVVQVGAQVTFTVEDDGPGVPGELRDRIFDPYVTTKEHGTGLGLAMVKKIVLEHDGTIAVGARAGGGARFTITLPLAPS